MRAVQYVPMVLAAGAVSVAVWTAPGATAKPDCVTTAPRTTQCQTGGSTQIVTSPPETNNPWIGWPFGGFVIGFGM